MWRSSGMKRTATCPTALQARAGFQLSLPHAEKSQLSMATTQQQLDEAEQRMAALRDAGHAVAARYDRRRARVVVKLSTGVELTFPARLAEGLADAPAEALAEIEVSPAGLGLHWPKLDADLYVPALLQGVFGSKKWMARKLGAQGGRSRTAAKIAAAKANGRKGGRPVSWLRPDKWSRYDAGETEYPISPSVALRNIDR